MSYPPFAWPPLSHTTDKTPSHEALGVLVDLVAYAERVPGRRGSQRHRRQKVQRWLNRPLPVVAVGLSGHGHLVGPIVEIRYKPWVLVVWKGVRIRRPDDGPAEVRISREAASFDYFDTYEEAKEAQTKVPANIPHTIVNRCRLPKAGTEHMRSGERERQILAGRIPRDV